MDRIIDAAARLIAIICCLGIGMILLIALTSNV